MKTFQLYRMALLLAGSLFFNGLIAQGFGEIRGLIKNTNLEAVPFATVKILQGNQLVGGGQSDDKGYYKIKPLNPGSYEVVFMENSHITLKFNKVKVIPNDATYLDAKMSPNVLGEVTVTVQEKDYTQSGVDRNMYSFESISGKDLTQTAGYTSGSNIMEAVPLLVSDVVETPGGGLHFRGGRDGTSATYVDGVRTYGETRITGSAIENLTIFTGGVPACYGDMTSGAVILTTKSYFSGIRDKNLRNSEAREEREAEKRKTKAEEDEKNRQKEIDAEKAKEKAEQETEKK
jgi:hypothetical protein